MVWEEGEEKEGVEGEEDKRRKKGEGKRVKRTWQALVTLLSNVRGGVHTESTVQLSRIALSTSILNNFKLHTFSTIMCAVFHLPDEELALTVCLAS